MSNNSSHPNQQLISTGNIDLFNGESWSIAPTSPHLYTDVIKKDDDPAFVQTKDSLTQFNKNNSIEKNESDHIVISHKNATWEVSKPHLSLEQSNKDNTDELSLSKPDNEGEKVDDDDENDDDILNECPTKLTFETQLLPDDEGLDELFSQLMSDIEQWEQEDTADVLGLPISSGVDIPNIAELKDPEQIIQQHTLLSTRYLQLLNEYKLLREKSGLPTPLLFGDEFLESQDDPTKESAAPPLRLANLKSINTKEYVFFVVFIAWCILAAVLIGVYALREMEGAKGTIRPSTLISNGNIREEWTRTTMRVVRTVAPRPIGQECFLKFWFFNFCGSGNGGNRNWWV